MVTNDRIFFGRFLLWRLILSEICDITVPNPDVADYLSSMNVDILRPFNLVWLENEERNEIEYVGCQYIVFGSCDGKFTKKVGDILVEINTNHHPSDDCIADEHFILDFGTVILTRT